jgi:hypothetical protein
MNRSITKKSVKVFLLIIAGSLIFTLQTGRAHAEANILCEPDKNLFDKISAAFSTLDIRKTTVNMTTSLLLDIPTQMVFNRSIKGVQQCYVWLLEKNTTTLDWDTKVPAECKATSADCSDIDQTYGVAAMNLNGKSFASNTTSGSLLGVANFVQGAVLNEPLPVNMAYWWNDNVTRVPFAGKALAQEVTYSGPLLPAIFNAWKVFRNLSYAILALILLVVGFMIITRRKINPQVSVTVQTALPRVILAVILITFSYPIGAAAASFAWVVGVNALRIAYSAGFTGCSTPGCMFDNFSLGSLAIALLGQALIFGGMGVIWSLASMLAIAGIIISFIIAMIRVFTTYLRLIFSIIFAPVIIAAGALPGNENLTEKWLRELGANMVIIPAIFGTIGLTGAILASLWLSGPLEGAWGSTVLVVLGYPFIGLYGFTMASKMPKIIRGWLVPEPGGKKR